VEGWRRLVLRKLGQMKILHVLRIRPRHLGVAVALLWFAVLPSVAVAKVYPTTLILGQHVPTVRFLAFGRLRSDQARCMAGREVTVYSMQTEQKGGWQEVGSALTDAKGQWKITAQINPYEFEFSAHVAAKRIRSSMGRSTCGAVSKTWEEPEVD
jgi:hypothetical protein